MLGKLILGITSGYAFSHFEFKGKKFLFFAVLFTLMLPLELRVVPLFELISALGCANTYTGLVLPLSGPTLAGLAIVNFLSMWNTYLWPLMIINDDQMKTAQLGVKMLFTPASDREWGMIMAGTVTVVIPALILFMLSQRFFVKGIAT